MPQIGRIGFRLVTGVPRPDSSLVAQFHGIPTTTLTDAMGRFRFMDPGIRPRTGLPLYGVALTVNTRPGDNLMVHKAMSIAHPGDVLVISTNGATTSAVFGELMCRVARAAGIAGIVVDGAIRDTDAIRALGFPAFSRSICAGAGDKEGPGEVNVPISCGNAVVMPGDIVVGDGDGVVTIPSGEAAEILVRIGDLETREHSYIERITGGDLLLADVDAVLRRRGILPEQV